MTDEEKKKAAIQAGIDADVKIMLEKKAGESVFHRTMEATNASAALNGIAILIAEFSLLVQRPVDSVLGMLAAVLIAPAGDDIKQ